LIGATLLSTVASLAAAEIRTTDRVQRWDLSIETRYTDSRVFDGPQGSSLRLEDDLGWGFGFGYNLNERLRLGMLMSWRSINYDATFFNNADLTTPLYYGGWLDVGTFAATAQFNLLPKTFTPYVNGGIGWTLIDTNIVADYSAGCYWDPWWGYICNGYTSTYGTDTASFLLGVGARFEPSEAVFIQIGYERGWLDFDNNDGNYFDMIRVDLGFTN
jgi:opacity protein-like surface antigen